MIQNKIIDIWNSKNMFVSVYADLEKDQFFATLMNKYGDTLLSVGFSSPNGADIRDFNFSQMKTLSDALDDWWNKQNFSNVLFEDMIPSLLKLCKIVNNLYNKI